MGAYFVFQPKHLGFDGGTLVARLESTRHADEILERILDRGIVLDGPSLLAALTSNSRMHAEALADDSRARITPRSILCAPRQTDEK